MREKFGPEEFSYMPETLVIPRYVFGINEKCFIAYTFLYTDRDKPEVHTTGIMSLLLNLEN